MGLICIDQYVSVGNEYQNHAKKEAYRESETIADDWVESGGDIGDFVKEFMETRILYHTRAAKAERLCMSMR